MKSRVGCEIVHSANQLSSPMPWNARSRHMGGDGSCARPCAHAWLMGAYFGTQRHDWPRCFVPHGTSVHVGSYEVRQRVSSDSTFTIEHFTLSCATARGRTRVVCEVCGDDAGCSWMPVRARARTCSSVLHHVLDIGTFIAKHCNPRCISQRRTGRTRAICIEGRAGAHGTAAACTPA